MPNGKLKLVVSSDVRRLFEVAAEGFLIPLRASASQPFPTPNYLLSLRQGGLRDDLIRIAAKAGCRGWFDPPLCIFNELPKWLGEPEADVMNDIDRLSLLGKVVRDVGSDVFGQSDRMAFFLESLDGLIGELVSEGVTPGELERAMARLLGGESAFDNRKNADLVAIYRAYVSALNDSGARDGRGTLAASADIVAADPRGFETRLGGRREIRFFGLADLRGGWRKLLHGLAKSQAVDTIGIYTMQEFSELDLAGLPPASIERLSANQSLAGSIFRQADPPGPGSPPESFTTIDAPNVEREVTEVAIEVRRLADTGIPLNRIGVVARSGRPYVELVVRALEKTGVPATARLRMAFDEIPAVKAVCALLAAASEGWTRQGLADIAGMPLFKPLLDSSVLNFIGYRRSVRGLHVWRQALEDLLQEAETAPRRDDDGDAHGGHTPSLARIRNAISGFREFMAEVIDLERDRSLVEWIERIEAFLGEDPFECKRRVYHAPGSNYEAVRRDVAGWRGLEEILRVWKGAVVRWGDVAAVDPTLGSALSISEFTRRFRDMLTGQIGIWTESHRGVQVLEALAAAYRDFDHLFLVGMQAGAFPLPAPGSPILDDDDRRVLADEGIHLDTREVWDARERELFRTIVSGAGRITVTHAATDSRGAETIRSSFVEALAEVANEVPLKIDDAVAPARCAPLFSSEEGRQQAIHAASIERTRQLNVSSPFSGAIEDQTLRRWLAVEFADSRLWSPSQIESYAKCPWAYFSGRLLNIEKLDDPDEDMEASIRGIILHDALARFYERAGRDRAGPVFLRSADLEWAEPLMEDALDAAFADMERRAWTGHPLLRAIKRNELARVLLRYLAWEVEHHDKMEGTKGIAPTIVRTGAERHELSFGESGDIKLDRNGVSFRFRGTIDRVDKGLDPRIEEPERFVAAIDYKSSLGSVPGRGRAAAWDEGVVLQVPLYAYALTEILTNVKVSRVEYRALSGTKPGASPGEAYPHCLQLHLVDRKTGALTFNDADAQKMERALDHVCRHVLDIRNGRFPVSPARSCGCPAYCHAYDICRVTPERRDGR